MAPEKVTEQLRRGDVSINSAHKYKLERSSVRNPPTLHRQRGEGLQKSVEATREGFAEIIKTSTYLPDVAKV